MAKRSGERRQIADPEPHFQVLAGALQIMTADVSALEPLPRPLAPASGGDASGMAACAILSETAMGVPDAAAAPAALLTTEAMSAPQLSPLLAEACDDTTAADAADDATATDASGETATTEAATRNLLRLRQDWLFAGRLEQQPPPGDWRTWLVLGGRGSGKTRAGAEWIHALASAGRRSDLRIALVAETLGDAREVMIDGISGICRVARRNRPDFEISRRRLVWPNGAVAQIFSSEDPESLRGPQFHLAWCDDLHVMNSSIRVNLKKRL